MFCDSFTVLLEDWVHSHQALQKNESIPLQVMHEQALDYADTSLSAAVARSLQYFQLLQPFTEQAFIHSSKIKHS
jgi:hypothetical protein